jgi:uncharacterized protein YbjQ (UPF0145 family)
MHRYALALALALSVVTGVLFVPATFARDTLHNYSVEDALNRGITQGILLDNVKLYFAGQDHPPVLKAFGEFRTNKKTNAFNKSDKEACEWVLFSALKALQQRAHDLGGNAVIDIKSNYKNREFVSATEFQCGAGNIVAGVALKGTVVTLQ